MGLKPIIRRGLVSSAKAALALPGERFRRSAASILSDAVGDPAATAPAARPRSVLAESIETVELPAGPARFWCVGEIPAWRVGTFFSKEPETIEWMDSFEEGEVFWDIGANIGLYSIYAALTRKARVLAFEPGSANYCLLNRNIELNNLSGRVSAYCLALNDAFALASLHMTTTDFGAALSNFATTTEESRTVFEQGMIGISIDALIGQLGAAFPNHIKIDVDGIEKRIVAGAAATLADPRLRSLSIELDDRRPDDVRAIVRAAESAGLKFVAKRHAQMFDGGPNAAIFNHQFRRG